MAWVLYEIVFVLGWGGLLYVILACVVWSFVRSDKLDPESEGVLWLVAAAAAPGLLHFTLWQALWLSASHSDVIARFWFAPGHIIGVVLALKALSRDLPAARATLLGAVRWLVLIEAFMALGFSGLGFVFAPLLQ